MEYSSALVQEEVDEVCDQKEAERGGAGLEGAAGGTVDPAFILGDLCVDPR